MSEFQLPVSIQGQGLFFYIISFICFFSVVSFFLYENKSKRNILMEFLLAILSAITLGTSIFLALIRANVIL